MTRGMMLLMVALSMMALIAGGCAKKELVKTEEPVVAKTEPVKIETPKLVEQKPSADQIKAAQEQAAQEKELAQAAQAAAIEAEFGIAYFDFDKSDLRQDTRDVLSRNAEIMLKNRTKVKILIEGHCDERGSAEYNLALGERRAKSALQYLLTLGVSAERLSVVSYGKEKPAVQGSDEAAWAKNRRAVFTVVP